MAQRAILPSALKYKAPAIDWKWEGAFENYARSFVKRNLWRVREQFGSEEDALQEAACVFAYCLKLYRAKVDEPRWMMALFKCALTTHWNTASTRDSRRRGIPIPDKEEQIDFNQGPLAVALANASKECREFLRVIETAPADFLALIFSDDKPERINKRIWRLLGISRSVNIIAELRELLS